MKVVAVIPVARHTAKYTSLLYPIVSGDLMSFPEPPRIQCNIVEPKLDILKSLKFALIENILKLSFFKNVCYIRTGAVFSKM